MTLEEKVEHLPSPRRGKGGGDPSTLSGNQVKRSMFQLCPRLLCLRVYESLVGRVVRGMSLFDSGSLCVPERTPVGHTNTVVVLNVGPDYRRMVNESMFRVGSESREAEQ